MLIKTPSDGLTGKNDEDNFGFSYTMLNMYIETSKCIDDDVKYKIDLMHKQSEHKRNAIPYFKK